MKSNFIINFILQFIFSFEELNRLSKELFVSCSDIVLLSYNKYLMYYSSHFLMVVILALFILCVPVIIVSVIHITNHILFHSILFIFILGPSAFTGFPSALYSSTFVLLFLCCKAS